ncbi:hypothetical protein ES288_A08G117000v1 [Gossypium darwinii]|uniref:beta-ketoacyl-[acyl-carrier-protein] synthase I n=1 Tax=Gossypium darwinii TaxID=34276 RepID=A0A5D2FIZ9_GOSDA|nr:hypothetical protein ES288_A08G117000v1 [Gossypium darwinii]
MFGLVYWLSQYTPNRWTPPNPSLSRVCLLPPFHFFSFLADLLSVDLLSVLPSRLPSLLSSFLLPSAHLLKFRLISFYLLPSFLFLYNLSVTLSIGLLNQSTLFRLLSSSGFRHSFDRLLSRKVKVTALLVQRRVVVTGMGVVTPLGHEPDVFYNNLLEGVSGISEIETFDCAQFPKRIAGEIKSFSTDGWVAPKFSKRMDKFMLYSLTARKKALQDGGVNEDVMEELDKTKCGVLIGSAMGGMKVFNDAIEALRISYRKMNPFCVPFATTNMGYTMLAMDLVSLNLDSAMLR